MRNRLLLPLLLVLFCESSLVAQLKYDFPQFGDETWRFVKQPAKWDGSDWLKLGLTGAGTFLLIQYADQPIRDAALRNQQYSKSVPVEIGRVWGEVYMPVVLFGGFALHSWLADDMGTRKIAYEIGQASIYAGVTNYLLKVAFGRARPYTEEGPKTFHPFSSLFAADYHSLPGGHNTVAFVLSTVLSRNAKPLWLKGVAYVPAVFTFVSRVMQDQHWTSDDFLGAAFGYFIATWVVDQHENGASNVEVSSVYPLTIRIVL